MKIRIVHKVIYRRQTHRFTVTIECPFRPDPDLMFVFRNQTEGGDDCALLLDHIDGWDATHQELLVQTKEWNIDDWLTNNHVPGDAFEDAVTQLREVVGCEYIPPRDGARDGKTE